VPADMLAARFVDFVDRETRFVMIAEDRCRDRSNVKSDGLQ